MITQDRLRQLYSYDPITGDFTHNKKRGNKKPGEIAIATDSKGYKTIGIDYINLYAHRMAFLYMTGEIPPMVDHINGDTGDNSWNNLRASNAFLNQHNRKHKVGKQGYKYVFRQSPTSSFGYQFRILGVRYYKSGFETAKKASEAATQAYKDAFKKYETQAKI